MNEIKNNTDLEKSSYGDSVTVISKKTFKEGEGNQFAIRKSDCEGRTQKCAEDATEEQTAKLVDHPEYAGLDGVLTDFEKALIESDFSL